MREFCLKQLSKVFYFSLYREVVGGLTTLWLICCAFYMMGTVTKFSLNQTLLSNLSVHIAGIAIFIGALLVAMRAPIRGFTFAFLALIGVFIPLNSLKTVPFSAQTDVPALDIISFNILHYNKQGAVAFEYLKNSGADVLVIPESSPLREFQAQLEQVYPYKLGCGEDICELMIFSKHPFLKADENRFPWGLNRLSTATINFHGKDVRIIATHLTKSFFSDLRIRELQQIVRIMREDNTPYVLAGDFNATPWSPEIQRMLGRTHTFLIDHIIGTWPVELGHFGLPIDHIMISKGIAPLSYDALPSAFGSNHRGVRAKVVIQ
jgi:endonuclease/exonuclease/phosphatase (EEP) superfamily protein YafD